MWRLLTVWLFWINSAWGNFPRYPYYDIPRPVYPFDGNIKDDYFLDAGDLDGLDNPTEVPGWGFTETPLGQVTGIAIGKDGNPVILHRSTRIWMPFSFNETEQFQESEPIKEDVVLTLDFRTGKVIRSWGKNKFFMPHGITIDSKENVWITDVGLHQIFKFAANSLKEIMVLGERMKPGSDIKHFCKPTSVAVTSSGDFYVADGYCNNRVVAFHSDGKFKYMFGSSDNLNPASALALPHGLALNERLDVLCIADRENSRTTCVNAGIENPDKLGHPISHIYQPYGLEVYDVAFYDNLIVGVARNAEDVAIGFTSNLQEIVAVWEPIQLLHNPHAIAADEKRKVLYVTEIGPNRVWKFNVNAHN